MTQAGALAELLAYRAIQYSNRYLTDGFVSMEALASLVAGIPDCYWPSELIPSRLAEILVNRGLWHRRDSGGFDIHDYLEYNFSRAQILARRERSGLGGRKAAESHTSKTLGEHVSNGSSVAFDVEPSPFPPITDQPGRQKRSPATSITIDPEFERFFSAYPRRVAKTRTRAAWTKIGVANGLAEKIFGALEKQTADWKKRGTANDLIPHPASWLNGKRWEDEIEDLFARDPYAGFPRV